MNTWSSVEATAAHLWATAIVQGAARRCWRSLRSPCGAAKSALAPPSEGARLSPKGVPALT